MNNDEKPASQQIDDIITNTPDWRGEKLATVRKVILQADPTIVEAVKWKKPSKPEGVAVWMSNGNICMADILKNAVRLNFPKGAQISDPQKIFNTRLDSKSIRAVDFTENASIDEKALAAIIIEAVKLNN